MEHQNLIQTMKNNFLIGEIIGERYKIQSFLKEGGTSLIYKAFDLERQIDVAVKLLKPDFTSFQIEGIIRFKKEVSIVSKLNHPKIIKIYYTGDYNNIPFIVMELLNDQPLSNSFDHNRNFKLQEIVDIIKQITKVLIYLHNKEIIHRDLKPSNIIIGKNREKTDKVSIKLIDFGLSYIKNCITVKS